MRYRLPVLAVLILGMGGGFALAQQAPGGAATGGDDGPKAGGAASAEGQPQQKFQSSFWDIDANQDGAIDPDEVQGHWDVVERWIELDSDGNGKIEREEFAAFERGSAEQQQESQGGELPEDKRIEGQTEIPPQEQLNLRKEK